MMLMMRHRTLLMILSILLAVVVPLFTALKSHKAVSNAPVIKVEIEPYDPRDLLYGHYLAYTVKWNWKNSKPDETACQNGACCLCVGAGSENPEVSLRACSPPKNAPAKECSYEIQGEYRGGNIFDIGIDRYYVDEEIALPLENIFQQKTEKFSIGLAMTPHKPVLEKLYVGGMDIFEYVRVHGVENIKNQGQPAELIP
jgi:uncharacterized membrane-anchored protein